MHDTHEGISLSLARARTWSDIALVDRQWNTNRTERSNSARERKATKEAEASSSFASLPLFVVVVVIVVVMEFVPPPAYPAPPPPPTVKAADSRDDSVADDGGHDDGGHATTQRVPTSDATPSASTGTGEASLRVAAESSASSNRDSSDSLSSSSEPEELTEYDDVWVTSVPPWHGSLRRQPLVVLGNDAVHGTQRDLIQPIVVRT